MPLSILYKPVVLSEERYDKIKPELGHLVITTQTKDYSNTKGINSSLTPVEQLVGYKAKIPLINKEFEYPIQYISIDFVKQSGAIPIYFARDIIINKSYYAIEDGNLYFTKSLEEIVSEQYLEFETELQQANLFLTTIYFDIHIFFDRFVPDNTTKTNNLALAQATSYAIMDYFNQYTYAEVTANMISEIAYTETLTFWSTLISTPLIALGSWAIMGTQTFLAQAEVGTVKALLTQLIGQFITAPIKEVFQEIIEDGFKEAIAENFVDLLGGTEDVGFWLSSIWTSAREVGGALGQITLGKSGGTKTSLSTVASIVSARLSGDTEIKNNIINQLKYDLAQKKQAAQQKRAKMSTWQKLMNSGAFKGILMMTSAFLFGSLSFLGVNKMLKSTIKISSQAYGEAKAISHANRKKGIIKSHGENNFYENLKNMENKMKKPGSIDGSALSDIFRGKQKSDTNTDLENPPAINIANRINPNPQLLKSESSFGYSPHKFGFFEFPAPEFEIMEGREKNRQLQESFRETERNEERIAEYNDYNDLADYGIQYSPSKDTNINDFLKEEMQLTDRILAYNVFVNGKEIEPRSWSDLEISPKDRVAVIPYAGFTEIIHDIEAKLKLEVEKDIDKQENSLTFLQPWEIETLENLYYRRKDIFYEKTSSFTAGTISPNAAHYKFLIDRITKVLLDNHVIASVNPEVIGELISPSGSKGAYQDKMSKLRTGKASGGFGLTEANLDILYANIWYKIQTKVISNEIKENILRQINSIFSTQFNFYGYKSENPFYTKIKQAYMNLVKVSKESGIITSFSKEKFNKDFNFDPHLNNLKKGSIPYKQTWVDLGSRLIEKLRNNLGTDSGVSFIPIINSIITEISAAISNERKSIDILKESRNSKGEITLPDGMKKNLLRDIINCPDTDVLKMIDSLKQLDFLLFDYPSYRDTSVTYITSYFISPDFRSLAYIERLEQRFYRLELSDFEKVNLRDEIDKETLNKLKEHVKNVVSAFIQSSGINNYDLVGKTYETKDLRDLQLEAIRTIWKAAAFKEDNFFISFEQVTNIFDIYPNFYSDHVSSSGMMTDFLVMKFANKLDEFIFEESSIVITDPTLSNNKLNVYIDAKNKLLEYMQLNDETMEVWLKSNPKTWFDNLFTPSTAGRSVGYTIGWGDPLYRGFAVSMDLFGLLGISPLTGRLIPDAVFDTNDPLSYALHHLDGNTLSLAMYNQILVVGANTLGYHLAYQTMSNTQQLTLKVGLERLLQIGFKKSSASLISGTQVREWITLNDFKQIFPDSLKFTVKFKGTTYTNSLRELWEMVFGFGSGTIGMNLFDINSQIQSVKDDGYIGWMQDKYPVAEERFLKNAERFVSQFVKLIDQNLFTGTYSEKDLVYRWHVYLMRKIFRI